MYCYIQGGWQVWQEYYCPATLPHYQVDSGVVVSGSVSNVGCDFVVFPVHGVEYNYVCGRTVGYSFNAPVGFYYGTEYSYTIEYQYVSGVSITHGAPGSRNHIWSYAAGQREDISSEFNCPCAAAHPSTEPLTPDYVGDHYYCDTATYYHPKVEWYTNNTLWDGKEQVLWQWAPAMVLEDTASWDLRRCGGSLVYISWQCRIWQSINRATGGVCPLSTTDKRLDREQENYHSEPNS